MTTSKADRDRIGNDGKNKGGEAGFEKRTAKTAGLNRNTRAKRATIAKEAKDGRIGTRNHFHSDSIADEALQHHGQQNRI